MNELVACTHLMKQGYNVFRAISPSCPFDLYVAKTNESLRVEVTTGHLYRRNITDRLGAFFPSKKFDRLLRGEFDMLVVVFGQDVRVFKTEEDIEAYRKEFSPAKRVMVP